MERFFLNAADFGVGSEAFPAICSLRDTSKTGRELPIAGLGFRKKDQGSVGVFPVVEVIVGIVGKDMLPRRVDKFPDGRSAADIGL